MIVITNRHIHYHYHLLDKYEAGIVLTGTELKSILQGQCSLKTAFVWINKQEVFLLECYIAPYDHGNIFNVNPNRARKLLLHKREIIKLALKVKQEKLQLVPYKFYFRHNKLKLEFYTAKCKKLFDKRETIKQRDLNRKIQF